MAKQADRVKETSKSLGTNDMLLEGAVFGAQRFASGYNVGDTDIRYVIEHQTKEEWEVGRGTLVSPIDLQRDEVIENSAGTNTLLSFTNGTKEIFSAPDSRDITGLYNSLTDYNVLDYGVFGDGTNDDTAGIREAIDQARQDGGGVIFFPPGRYKVTQPGMLEDIFKIDFGDVVIRGSDSSTTEIFSTITYPQTTTAAPGDTIEGNISVDYPIYVEFTGSGGFLPGDTITGQVSGATAYVEKVYGSKNSAGSGSITNKCLVITGISGTFQVNEQILGSNSSAIGIIAQTPRLWRGSIFQIAGSSNQYTPLKNVTFENITLNGSTIYELSSQNPASLSTGNGIDYSHKGIYVLKNTYVDNILIKHSYFRNFRGPVISTINTGTLNISIRNNRFYQVKMATQINGYLSCLNNEVSEVAVIGHKDDLKAGRYSNNRYRNFEGEGIETRSRNGVSGVETLNINNCIFDNIKDSVISIIQGQRGQGNINNNTIKDSAYIQSTSAAIQCVKRGDDYDTFSNLRITGNLISVTNYVMKNAFYFDWVSSVTEVSNIIVDYNTVNGDTVGGNRIQNSLIWNGRSTIAKYENNIIRNNTFNDCDNPPQNTGTSVTNFGKPFPMVVGNLDNGFTNEPEIVADNTVKYPFYNRYKVTSTGGEAYLYLNKNYYTKGQAFNLYGASNANTAVLPLDNNTVILDQTWVGALGNTIRLFYCPEQNVFLEDYRTDRLGPIATQSTGTTLDVSGKNKVVLDYSSPTVITDYQNFPERSKVLIHSRNGNVTIASNTRIRNSAGTDLKLPAGGTVEYIQIDNTLYQVGLDVNFKVYNVRLYGAVLDGVTDDRAPIQAAIDEASAMGGGYVVVDGPAYLEDYETRQGVSSHLFVTADNVIVYLTPQARLNSNTDSAYVLSVGGYFNTNWLTQTLYPLEPTDVYLKSSNTIQLEVQSDIQYFNKGDHIYIRTGDTNEGVDEVPLQNISRVYNISSSIAEIELYEPLPRKFQREVYPAADPLNSGYAPFGVLNLSEIPDSYVTNSGFDGYGHVESSGPVLYARQCANCRFRNWVIKTQGINIGFMHTVFDSKVEKLWIEGDNIVDATSFTWWGGVNNVTENCYFASPGLMSYVISRGETNHRLSGLTLLSNLIATEGSFLAAESSDLLITEANGYNIEVESGYDSEPTTSEFLLANSGDPLLTSDGQEIYLEDTGTTSVSMQSDDVFGINPITATATNDNTLETTDGDALTTSSNNIIQVSSINPNIGTANIAVVNRAEDVTIENARLYSRTTDNMIKVDDTCQYGHIDMVTLNSDSEASISVPTTWTVSNNVSADRIITLSADSAYESGNKTIPLEDFEGTVGNPNLTTFNVLYQGWIFDSTADETISTTFHNNNWRKYKVEIYYTNTTSTTGTIVWETSINGYTVNSILDSASAGSDSASVSSPGQFEINKLVLDPDVDVPVNSLIRLDISRLGSDGSDTLGSDISILGIKVIRKE